MSNGYFAFRVDLSREIGAGHFMRCLALADVLKNHGAVVRFVCRDLPPVFEENLIAKGHECVRLGFGQSATSVTEDRTSSEQPYSHWLSTSLTRDAEDTAHALADRIWDWLIVDHYALDARWEKTLRPTCRFLMVIDDLADRPHDCDLLLDQNLGRQATDYSARVSKSCITLIGPLYALLRPEFSEWRPRSLSRRAAPELKRLLVSLGGVDQDNATSQVLVGLNSSALPADCHITVILGPTAPWLSEVRSVASALPWPTEVLVNVSNMAQVMAKSDLAIGAAGGSAWERCVLGLPTVLVILADNQHLGAIALADSGSVVLLGKATEIGDGLKQVLSQFSDNNMLTAMIRAAAKIADGEGASRVARRLLNSDSDKLNVRQVVPDDEGLLFEWANDPIARRNSFNTNPILPETHHVWFTRRLNKPDFYRIYIIENSATLPIGQVRFERDERGDWETSYLLARPFRSRGLGSSLLETALRQFQIEYPGTTIIGKVRIENQPSCKIFENMYFEKNIDELTGIATYSKVLG
jgi:UDP-2,4-diacetamido-2,4,6-trideoxy-beta-L-altropyranose hydrolase